MVIAGHRSLGVCKGSHDGIKRRLSNIQASYLHSTVPSWCQLPLRPCPGQGPRTRRPSQRTQAASAAEGCLLNTQEVVKPLRISCSAQCNSGDMQRSTDCSVDPAGNRQARHRASQLAAWELHVHVDLGARTTPQLQQRTHTCGPATRLPTLAPLSLYPLCQQGARVKARTYVRHTNPFALSAARPSITLNTFSTAQVMAMGAGLAGSAHLPGSRHPGQVTRTPCCMYSANIPTFLQWPHRKVRRWVSVPPVHAC